MVQIATEIDSVEKWRSVADLATQKCELKLASEALRKAKDHGGLLLLATSSGNKAAVQHLAQGLYFRQKCFETHVTEVSGPCYKYYDLFI